MPFWATVKARWLIFKRNSTYIHHQGNVNHMRLGPIQSESRPQTCAELPHGILSLNPEISFSRMPLRTVLAAATQNSRTGDNAD